MKAFDLSGRRALVTGGSRGIGRAISLALAECGADVAIIYRSAAQAAESVQAAIRAQGRSCVLYQQDLTQVEAIPDLVERIWQEAGPLHILVNNAGVAFPERYHKVTEEHFDRVMAVNLKAPFFLTKEVARRMAQAGIAGRIINIGSTNGFLAEADLSTYNVSKGGLEMMTKSFAIELAPHGITVNSVAPGLIQTEIVSEEVPPSMWEYLLEHVPLGRIGTPQDCTGAVILLASDAGSYITGQHIIIDGGIICEQIPRLKFGQ